MPKYLGTFLMNDENARVSIAVEPPMVLLVWTYKSRTSPHLRHSLYRRTPDWVREEAKIERESNVYVNLPYADMLDAAADLAEGK